VKEVCLLLKKRLFWSKFRELIDLNGVYLALVWTCWLVEDLTRFITHLYELGERALSFVYKRIPSYPQNFKDLLKHAPLSV